MYVCVGGYGRLSGRKNISVNFAAILCVTVSAMVPLVSESNSDISKVAEPHDVSFFSLFRVGGDSLVALAMAKPINSEGYRL